MDSSLNFLILKNEPNRPNSSTYRNKNTWPAQIYTIQYLKPSPHQSPSLNLSPTSIHGRKHFDEQNSNLGHFTKTHRFHVTALQRPDSKSKVLNYCPFIHSPQLHRYYELDKYYIPHDLSEKKKITIFFILT